MSFHPDPAAVPSNTTFVAFLSQRDLELRVPVNFVTYAGIALTPACFANQHYEDAAAARCISNLLVSELRRIDVDLYWDASRSVWSLCPVELGSSGVVPSSVTIAPTSVVTATSLNENLDALETVRLDGSLSEEGFAVRRQTTEAGTDVLQISVVDSGSSPVTSMPSATATVTANLTATTSGSAPATSTAVSNGTVIQVGPYTCSPDSNFDLLLQTVAGYMTNTENNLDATTLILNLRVHAAAPVSNPQVAREPPPNGLPQPDSLLSSIISSNLSQVLYTPVDLINQRADLNSTGSFFAVARTSQPKASYFQLDDVNGHFSTPDGWPSESFMEMERGQRLIVGFGEVDPQMLKYNFTGDQSTIFPIGYLESPRQVAISSSGTVTSGCVFSPTTSEIAQVNSSWAVASIGNGGLAARSAFESTLTEAQNLTACGITPILNHTLDGLTADQNATLYKSYVRSTIWSWDHDQPINTSTSGEMSTYRCAALNSSSGYYQVAQCADNHYGACRIGLKPYSWEFTSTSTPYERIHLACGDNSTFDVPRSAMENRYLLEAWRGYQARHDDDAGPLLWLNFNDLDVSGCWVIGQNTTCPYERSNVQASRQVVVPTVAGVLVFVIATLTVLVKCAGNRRNSRRRRKRGDDGWDYEGVPS